MLEPEQDGSGGTDEQKSCQAARSADPKAVDLRLTNAGLGGNDHADYAGS
jgi:hypothetical protein